MANTQSAQVRAAFAEVIDLIPQRARTVIYVAAVAVAVMAFVAKRMASIWWPEVNDQVDATVADVVTAALFVIGLLASSYRPTRSELIPIGPLEPSHLELAQAQEAQARTIATLIPNGWSKDEATAAVTNNQLLATGESPGAPIQP